MTGELPIKLLEGMKREELLEILSDGFCQHCVDLLQSRIRSLNLTKKIDTVSMSGNGSKVSREFQPTNQPGLHSSPSENDLESVIDSSNCRERQKASNPSSSPGSVNSHQRNSGNLGNLGSRILLNSGIGAMASASDNGLSEDQIRFSEIRRKKDFSLIENVNGKRINIVQGLELHSGVFDAEEQKNIVKCLYDLQQKGQKGLLRERTYSEPKKWMRGKGRITIQFGCCYNYAVDKNGNPPGILRDEEVDPLPPLFKQMIKRMIRCHVLPPTCVPNSCIVNIYDEGDCIPPHIDHHDFLRPFCTVSFLTECNILFGSSLKIVDAGEFSGPFSLPLPCGSVLILNGNGADIAKHCVPGVPGKRISITFRKMDDSKLPYKFSPDPELLGIKPLGSSPSTKMPYQQKPLGHYSITKSPMLQNNNQNKKLAENAYGSNNTGFSIDTGDFPPLGGPNFSSRPKANKVGSKQ